MGLVLIADAQGRALALGADTAGLTPPEGGHAIPVPDGARDQWRDAEAAAVAAGQPFDLAWDGAAIVARTRAANAAERDEADRADLAGTLATALANWASLTAAQKDALLRVCVRACLRAVRR